MKSLMIPVAVLLGATLAAGAQAQQSSPRPAPSPAASAISTPDYVQTQARGDLFEIEAGRLAVQKAQSPDLKQFAQMMIDDHTQASTKLQQAMKSGNVTTAVPKTLDSRHSQALDQLKNAPAGQFDQAYFQSQVQGHREMLALNQSYSQTGDNPALKQFSAQTVPVVQKHLSALQQMASAGGSSGAAGGTNARTSAGGTVGTSGAPDVAGTRGSSGQMDVLDPGTGASSGAGAAGEQVIQREPIGPGGPRQFNQPGRDDGGQRDD